MYQEKFLLEEFEVVLAFNGEQWIEAAGKEKPDIIKK
jgi:hypothetical protein